jgi:DNA-binding transcriptional LysR family regulator
MVKSLDVDLNHLTTFVKVADAASFTLAANTLGVPKSTVSRRVSALEAALGVRLIRRTTRKLSLTEEGTSYYEKTARALEAIDEAGRAVADMDGTPRGLVRITAPVDVGNDVLADLVPKFLKEHPSISVEVQLTGRRVDLVEESFDLALRAGTLGDSSLIARKIGTSCMRVFGARSYIERAGAPKKLADLQSHPLVLFRTRQGQAELTFAGPKGAETITLQGVIGTNDFAFARKAVVAGAGIGILPAVLCRKEIDSGVLEQVLPKYSVPGGAFHIVYPSGRYVPQRVALFRDFLLKELSAIFPKE